MPTRAATVLFPIRSGLPSFLAFPRKVTGFEKILAEKEITEKAE
jgi:hypothetical protein